MIYLDYAATSIKRKDVLAEILENIEKYDGNASSTHVFGRSVKKELEAARRLIASAIGASAKNIIFNSGASESNNTVLANFDDENIDIVTTNIEHKSVLEPLEKSAAKAIYLKANKDGLVSLDELKELLSENCKLVVIGYVNNELGTIQRLAEVGEFLKEKDVWFHVDAVQALGHIDIDVDEIGCDSLSLSGHKIGGLNGLGILYLRKNIKPFILGGSQEGARRAGTQDVMAAVSMARCIELINEEREKTLTLKNYLLKSLAEAGIPFKVNGSLEEASNHILNIYLPFVKNDLLLTFLDTNGICVSAGSACLSGTLEPSYVIENIYDRERAEHSIRFSFGFTNTEADIDKLVEVIDKIYQRKKNG